jgi:hypothetical protein
VDTPHPQVSKDNMKQSEVATRVINHKIIATLSTEEKKKYEDVIDLLQRRL